MTRPSNHPHRRLGALAEVTRRWREIRILPPDIKEVADEFKTVLPFNFPLMLNRSGKYTVVITATDKLANKTAKQELSLTVLDVK